MNSKDKFEKDVLEAWQEDSHKVSEEKVFEALDEIGSEPAPLQLKNKLLHPEALATQRKERPSFFFRAPVFIPLAALLLITFAFYPEGEEISIPNSADLPAATAQEYALVLEAFGENDSLNDFAIDIFNEELTLLEEVL